MVDRTDDGRWILVDGRRWRASDPAIPDTFRQELVDELMAARRAVDVATRAKDSDAVAAARHRVDDAKRALGERGRAWWEERTAASIDERLRATILTLARHRAPKTLCPSDAARTIGGASWRSLMDDARSAGAVLQQEGLIDVTQGGETVVLGAGVHGPIRFRLDEANSGPSTMSGTSEGP